MSKPSSRNAIAGCSIESELVIGGEEEQPNQRKPKKWPNGRYSNVDRHA